MKTLLFTLEYPPFKGGIANYYAHIANYWPLNEKLLVLDNNKNELLTIDEGYLRWLPAIGALHRKIKKSQIDYVLVGQILPLGTVAWLVSWFSPFKYSVFLHGMDLSYALKNTRKRILAKLILKRANAIICNSAYVAQKVLEFYPDGETKTSVVNPGISGDIPYVSPDKLDELTIAHELEGKTVLLSLGRLVRRKGVDMTIHALEQMPETALNNLRYFVAGVGPEEMELRRLVPDRLESNIIFLGQLDEDEKWAWLKRCDIFIMPSRDIMGDLEGFGIVYLEANLSGKAVIAGDSGGVRDAVINDYNGILVNPENIDDIKNAIIKLATDPALRAQLGEQGRQRAQQKFNWEKQVAKIISIITAN